MPMLASIAMTDSGSKYIFFFSPRKAELGRKRNLKWILVTGVKAVPGGVYFSGKVGEEDGRGWLLREFPTALQQMLDY